MVLFLSVTGIMGALYEKEKAEFGALVLQRECGSLKLSDLLVRNRSNCRVHSAHMFKAMTHMEDTHKTYKVDMLRQQGLSHKNIWYAV